MYINTIVIPLRTWMASMVGLPTFSKILNIHIRNGSMFIMYSSESYDDKYSGDKKKTYNIRVICGLELSNQEIPDNYQFHKTIKVNENDFTEYYHIFIEEIKTASEIRDTKIEEIIK